MPNYDFKTLSPVDFEVLSRDLLQEEHRLTLQSFTSGRDGGIDFRYSRDASGSLVVQCKHYVESGYESLLRVIQFRRFLGLDNPFQSVWRILHYLIMQ